MACLIIMVVIKVTTVITMVMMITVIMMVMTTAITDHSDNKGVFLVYRGGSRGGGVCSRGRGRGHQGHGRAGYQLHKNMACLVTTVIM